MKGGVNQSLDTLSFLGFYDSFHLWDPHGVGVRKGWGPTVCRLCFRLRKIAFWTRWSDAKLVVEGEVLILGIFFFFFGNFFLFLVPWSPGPLIPWCPGHLVPPSSRPLIVWSPVPWSSGPLVLWSPGPLVPWSPGPLVLWSSGPLLLWSSGPLVLCFFSFLFSNLSFTLFYYQFYIDFVLCLLV